jgi:hypothetical protein
MAARMAAVAGSVVGAGGVGGRGVAFGVVDVGCDGSVVGSGVVNQPGIGVWSFADMGEGVARTVPCSPSVVLVICEGLDKMDQQVGPRVQNSQMGCIHCLSQQQMGRERG